MAIVEKLRKAKEKVTRNSGMDNDELNIEREFERPSDDGDDGSNYKTKTGKKSYLGQAIEKGKEASAGAGDVIEDSESGDLDMFGGSSGGMDLDEPIDPMGLEQSPSGGMDDDLDIGLDDFD